MPCSANAWLPRLPPSLPLLSPARGLQVGNLQPNDLSAPPPQLQCVPTQLLLSAALRQFIAVSPRTPWWRGRGLPGPQPLTSELLWLTASPPLLPTPPGDMLQPSGPHGPTPPVQGKRLQPGGQVLQQAEQIVAHQVVLPRQRMGRLQL